MFCIAAESCHRFTFVKVVIMPPEPDSSYGRRVCTRFPRNHAEVGYGKGD